MLKSSLLLTLWAALTVSALSGCVPLAAGVVGAAVGHEVAKKNDENDGDKD